MIKARRRTYLDSNIIIYLVDGEPVRQTGTARLIRSLKLDTDFVTSEMTVGECLRGAFRRSNRGSAQSYRDLLLNPEFVALVPVDLALIQRATELGAELNMKLIDAIHVATAEALSCDVFLTNDRGIRAPAAVALRYLSAQV
ncbi:type II toxin-antitoxin system VapC family toxin [Rhizobium sp. SAFR-030]|uniref:type II toxin-antitoxin system VapC family toxin n=1 Tax=Rhizobium sp. SAFR-030 TaxID=3387277 RepID=UPI003F7E08D2